MARDTETRYHQCTICEAACGLELEVSGREVVGIRGDAEDAFSRGFVCPKGAALRELDADPDRLRQPLVRKGGVHVPVSWDEAFEAVDRGLRPIIDRHWQRRRGVLPRQSRRAQHGAPAVQPGAADRLPLAQPLQREHRGPVSEAGRRGLVFGTPFSVPVPDIDRSRFILMLGANPMASNGSLWTVPDFRGRARRMRERGGRLVVVDPRRSETAAIADEHVAIRPGTDALLLAGMVHTLFAEDLVRLGRLAQWTRGVEDVRRAIAPFGPEQVAPALRCTRRGDPAPRAGARGRRSGLRVRPDRHHDHRVRHHRELARRRPQRAGGPARPRGRRDVPEGRRVRVQHARAPGVGAGVRLHRHKSRVRGAPEVLGEFPCACLAEEIETPARDRCAR
jgi:anaerobic selenocysteine-containing dehydrogenase